MSTNNTVTTRDASTELPTDDLERGDIRSALEHALQGQQAGDVSPAELIGLAYDSLPPSAALDDVLPIARDLAGGTKR